jgi:hypothetical protein
MPMPLYWVLRGGSWNNNTRNCRVANRNNNNPDNRNNNNGFRVAREYSPIRVPEFIPSRWLVLGRRGNSHHSTS